MPLKPIIVNRFLYKLQRYLFKYFIKFLSYLYFFVEKHDVCFGKERYSWKKPRTAIQISFETQLDREKHIQY